jgi:hypothetical protein
MWQQRKYFVQKVLILENYHIQQYSISVTSSVHPAVEDNIWSGRLSLLEQRAFNIKWLAEKSEINGERRKKKKEDEGEGKKAKKKEEE